MPKHPNLRHQHDPATGEVEAAARQYVRKVSGFRQPSARNAEAFDAAIAEIAAASQRLILAMGGDVEPGPDRKPPARPRPEGEDQHARDHRPAGCTRTPTSRRPAVQPDATHVVLEP